MYKPTLKPYTLPSRSKNQQHEPKLVNKYVFANAPKEIKIVANLKDKMTENKECQWVTKAIRNAVKVLNMKILATNKIRSKLKVWYFKFPHYA